MARIARGKFLSIKESDFVSAARSMGASEIIEYRGILIPNFAGYILVQDHPGHSRHDFGRNLPELSGRGPEGAIVSWGVLPPQQAQKMQVVAMRPPLAATSRLCGCGCTRL